MNMVVPNLGKELFLRLCLGTQAPEPGFIVHLYQNDYTPADASDVPDFIESNFTGYAAQAVLRTSFTFGVVSNVAVAISSTPPEYTSLGAVSQTVYGWYMTDSTSSVVLAAQRFEAPRVMSLGTTERLDPFAFKLKTFA